MTMVNSSGWAVTWLPYLMGTAVVVASACGIVSGIKAYIRSRKAADERMSQDD
jgi:hypothetical protein